MTNEDLATWFMDEFWPLYLKLMKTPFATKFKQGTRGEALKKMLSLKPSQDLRERILLSLQAQIIHRQKLFDRCGSAQAYNEATEYNKFYCNRMASSWIFQMGWDDEIPGLDQVQEELPQNNVICSEPGCKNNVHGPRFDHCINHLPTDDPLVGKLRNYAKENGLTMKGLSPQEYVEKCREHLKTISPEMARRLGA